MAVADDRRAQIVTLPFEQWEWESRLPATSDEPARRRASLHWVLVQMISLSHVPGRELDEEYWMTAKLSAELDLELEGPARSLVAIRDR